VDRVNRVVIVPAKLGAGFDDLRRKEGDPWKFQIIRVDKNVLYKYIGRTRMIEVAPDVATRFRIHNKHAFIVEKILNIKCTIWVCEESIRIDCRRHFSQLLISIKKSTTILVVGLILRNTHGGNLIIHWNDN
jgi:hypothetical protein